MEQMELSLGQDKKTEWPSPLNAERPVIEQLTPDSPAHNRVKDYLLQKLTMSERAMREFYPRWQINETKLQAYVRLQDHERKLKEMNNDRGLSPKALEIIIPYSFASQQTIVTYLLHTFAGRKPMFQVGSYSAEGAQSAHYVEQVLQYNADHTRLIKQLVQFLNDTQTYGLGVLRTEFQVLRRMRTVWVPQEQRTTLGVPLGRKNVPQRQERVVYEGNAVESIDPFLFFPDPRVPMTEVNRRGEFVFWRSFQGKHWLRQQELDAGFMHTRAVGRLPGGDGNGAEQRSFRDLLSGGRGIPGRDDYSTGHAQNMVQIDQGVLWVVPAELGIGESRYPERWIFTIANKTQIVQAEPFDADHGMLPVAVAEPLSMGYGFGQPGTSDFVGPLQDTASWFINSHIRNVRASLNNMFVVDPSMVEMQDLVRPGDGKIIRLKRTAFGQDVRAALQQLQVQDVTRQHVNDVQMFMQMADSALGLNDNLRGILDPGGRKTATEVRTATEAGASRLAAQARIISAQALTDLTEQMVMNLQQYLSEEFYVQVVGMAGAEKPIRIGPDMLAGDFYFPVHDGTLPLDKVALLDTWKEIFMGVAQDQELRQQFSVPKIFEWIAELGGARNIDSFKLTPTPDAAVAQQAQAGNLVPVQDALAQLGAA